MYIYVIEYIETIDKETLYILKDILQRENIISITYTIIVFILRIIKKNTNQYCFSWKYKIIS